jgi:xanthine dehydrogenase accessory factor
MSAIWQAAVEELENGRNFVLATMIDVKGSSPRHVGTRFLIRQDGIIIGTIGGGLLEANVQKFAADALENGTSHRISFSFQGQDAESTDMICGGEAEVLVEFVDAGDKVKVEIFRRLLKIVKERKSGLFFSHASMAQGEQGDVNHLIVNDQGADVGGFSNDHLARSMVPQSRLLKPAQLIQMPESDEIVFLEWLHPIGTVFVFGAGHVGECVAHLAAYVDFKVVAIDDRSDFANQERFPDADDIIVLDSFNDAMSRSQVDSDSYLVIVTRGHAHDKKVLKQALETDAVYIGMIGSRRKNRIIFESLLQEGVDRKALERVHAPIGLPIGGETPQEIGVSIVAEMIQVRNRKGELQHIG